MRPTTSDSNHSIPEREYYRLALDLALQCMGPGSLNRFRRTWQRHRDLCRAACGLAQGTTKPSTPNTRRF